MALTATPPATSVDRARWARLAPPVIGAGLAAGTIVALHFHDPHVKGSWGLCPLYALTGIYCPGCGGLRAMNNLTNGDLLASVHSNVLLLPLLVFAAFTLWRWLSLRWRTDGPLRLPLTPWWGWVTVAVMAAFWVLRNTPWGTFLTPV